MSELRAPDPTLHALGWATIVPIEVASMSPRRVGHRYWPPRQCGADVEYQEAAGVAAYIAVACRDCFPDAPPPGHVWGADRGQRHIYRDSHLSWQAKPRRNQGDDDE